MNWKRILLGKLHLDWNNWQSWNCWGVDRYWSGRIIYLKISKVCMVVDCRIDVEHDLKTGKVT